ncbi:MAG: class I tRNA ligase family protein [Planctomycetota bacterium]
MFQPVTDSNFVTGEHSVLKLWLQQQTFQQLRRKNAGRKRWSFLDGPITANNPMGVHHAWGRTYKDTYQRFFAMTGHDQRFQNGFDCQGLWVEVEVEKQLGLGTKTAVHEVGIDNFVNECKRRVLRFAARQTEQSQRLGYWMDWDNPDQLRQLAEQLGTDEEVTITTPSGKTETAKAHQLVERLGNSEWGGSYFTFSTENNETIWTILKKCFERGKIYQGHDVMPWSGRGGSAYSQMEIAEGRKLTTHKSVFVRFPITSKSPLPRAGGESQGAGAAERTGPSSGLSATFSPDAGEKEQMEAKEYMLVWTTTPWTLTSNVACAVNPDLDYIKIQAKRDNAIYYFAKDNLHFQRLASEFRDGFGRPEWKWPEGVGKLKTLAQIFKEQGGFEELERIKGADMVGWEYGGPFDDLLAQQQLGGVPVDEHNLSRCGVNSHRVIDGGRDSRGSANVVAGEGTGIVHIAPGCGDIDHKMGVALGLPIIAPLQDDGTYSAEFGDFAGLEAIAPATAELVFEKLKTKGMLVAVETYPHIYPHCWRTGDELVFRLVDEWFINMDWRDEIKDVTRQIKWLPDSMDGQERKIEWLSNMSDWMISKKRFWGLALPIWVNEEDPSDFEVMGSLAELKERSIEGWGDFAGNTPHRPWIDGVIIESQTPGKEGQRMRRVPDVGNPWLDAGIVPFSTMGYNTHREEWQKWYPADLVTECFPGQFRNWFYSMLSLSTMMRYDEANNAEDKKPFRTLLGHRLVQNEQGKPMHKSDGTAIWFEEAAEQLGVDTMRWMYLAQNPAMDLRFGTRHHDKPVTLHTPDGPIEKTLEGVTTCMVTSGPADETRRQILIPLWNCYKFFVDYAIADGFVPSHDLRQRVACFVPSPPDKGEKVADRPDEGAASGTTSPNSKSQPPHPSPLPRNGGEVTAASDGYIAIASRPEIDRWILSNLQSLIEVAHREMSQYNEPGFCAAAAGFIDDLSNWYIRRNRRRFWRSKDATDTDKNAAYETLYEVLVTLCRLLAPCIPFITERMYQNLVLGRECSEVRPCSGIRENSESLPNSNESAYGHALPCSVHLCDYPIADTSLLDAGLNLSMSAAQKVVRLAHKLREESNLRVRQPLAELRFASSNVGTAEAIERLADVIGEELNIHRVVRQDNLDALVSYAYKPNLKTLGPKYGKLLNALRTKLPELGDAVLSPLRRGENLTIELDGQSVDLTPEDVLISTAQAAEWVCSDDSGIQVAISTVLTPELIREGMSRDFVRQVQQLRKDANLNIQDHIKVQYHSADNTVQAMVAEWGDYICRETLADSIEFKTSPGVDVKSVMVGDSPVQIWIVSQS